MKIKDIREFRTFYKEQIRELAIANRNEHFIGTRTGTAGNVSEYGFFDIYHGDKDKLQTEGIRGFLEGFLDMARDAQAVYEFLQNAVDAGSTRFMMRWGSDPDDTDGSTYLLVLNNGRQFDFAAVRSILNVGVSTKEAAQHTIGKFGIGFKLAHRLVGQNNGLDELLDQLYGPILFSWRNEELHHLAHNAPDTVLALPTAQTYTIDSETDGRPVSMTGSEPWLFKILITNFPCQPDETIRDASYRETSTAFTPAELNRVKQWLILHRDEIPWDDYREGSLFFIRLGPGKEQHLADERLEEGVKFSLAILNYTAPDRRAAHGGLRYVILNGTEVERAPLAFAGFTFPRDSPEFRYVRFGLALDDPAPLTDEQRRLADQDADIELLLGYAADYAQADALFAQAPNFYLYFPLSEERHKLQFVLHSNAFYKGTARTSLHVGTTTEWGLNERLLHAFAGRLSIALQAWSQPDAPTDDRQRFLAVYAALLLSEESTEANRTWINRPLVQPLHAALHTLVPVLAKDAPDGFSIAETPEQVRLRLTQLPIDPATWALPFRWFYWSDLPALRERAAGHLKLAGFTIIDALRQPMAAARLNALLANEPTWRAVLLEEIDRHLCHKQEDGRQPEVRTALQSLRLFEFTDGQAYSWDELQQDPTLADHLLAFDRIEPLRNLLTRVGFNLSTTNIERAYAGLHTLLQKVHQSTYLGDYTELNRHLNRRLVTNTFTKEEKLRVLRALEQSERSADERNRRAEVLRLFRNQSGQVVALRHIAKDNFGEAWLNAFCLHADERDEAVMRYLVGARSEVLERIVEPLWDQFVDNDYVRSVAGHFYEKVVELQTKLHPLNFSDRRVVLLHGVFVTRPANLLHGAGLNGFQAADYKVLRDLLSTHFGRVVADQKVVAWLSKPPFLIPESDFSDLRLTSPAELSAEEARLLIHLAQQQKTDLLTHHVWTTAPTSGRYILRPRVTVLGECQVWADSKSLAAYIKRHHPAYILAPDLTELKDTIALRGAALLELLLNAWDGQDGPTGAALAQLVLGQDDHLKLLYLQRVGRLEFDPSRRDELSRLRWAARVALSVSGREAEARTLWAATLWLTPASGAAFALAETSETSGDELLFVLSESSTASYKLRLSRLFPEAHGRQGAAVEATVAALLDEFPTEFEEVALWPLFGRTERPAQGAVVGKLVRHHDTVGYLGNGVQLALALLAAQAGLVEGYAWNIQLADGEIAPWGNAWALPGGFEFFTTDSYLPATYAEAATVLGLTDANPSFETAEAGLFLWPVLHQNRLLGPVWQTALPPGEHPALLNALLRYADRRQLLEAPQPWPDIWGFDVTTRVLVSQRLEPEESVPRSWTQWRGQFSDEVAKKRATTLLANLGLQMGFSPVCRLRAALLDEALPTEVAPGEVESITPTLLANTLKLVYQRQPAVVYDLTTPRGALLRRVVQTLLSADTDLTDLPLPVATEQPNCYLLRLLPAEGTAYFFGTEQAQALSHNFKLTLPTVLAAAPGVLVFDATPFDPSLPPLLPLRPLRLVERVDDAALQTLGEEWEEHFYITWREEYPGRTIQRVSAVALHLWLDAHAIRPQEQTGDIYVDGLTVYAPRALATAEVIRRLREQPGWLAIADALDAHYQQHKHRLTELLDGAGLSENPELADRIRLLRQELEAEARVRALKENLEAAPYTFSWFRDLIALWALQADDSDQTVPQKDISFERVLALPESERLLELRDPSRMITPTIEYCTDFSATLHLKRGGPPVNLSVQGVSKQAQRLVLMLSDPRELMVNGRRLDLAREVQRVELRFSTAIDLINHLLSAFRELGRRQGWAETFDLNQHLPARIRFLYGPPGTGKTTTLARDLIARQQALSTARIVVLTPTNKAADELADRIIKESGGVAPPWLVRYGATFSAAVLEHGCHYDRNSFALADWPGLVLITTVQRYPYETVNTRPVGQVGNAIRLCDIAWDGLWLDEASMLALPYTVFALHQRASLDDGATGVAGAEFVIGGDPQQIPPVLDIRDEDLPAQFDKEQNIYSMIGLSSFVPAEQEAQSPRYSHQVQNLDIQFRSTPAIGELFSHFTYKGLLKHGRATGVGGSFTPRPLPAAFMKVLAPGHEAAGISLLRFPVHANDSLYKPGKLRRSPYHPYSALLTLELIRHLAATLADEAQHTGAVVTWTVGVVCPYRAQATLVNKMVESLDLPLGLRVLVDTVHGFQGGECDLVFFLISPTNEWGRITNHPNQFLHKHYLVNVAISRARDHLVLLYPDEQTVGINNLIKIDAHTPDSIEHILREKLKLNLSTLTLHARRVEESLFGAGQPTFIESNCLTQGHELVNVYGQAPRKYRVVQSSTAVDVQFRQEPAT